MKKVLYFIFIVSITFFSIFNFFDYSNQISERIEDDKAIIEIKKPENLTNEEFVNNLISTFNDMNTDIMYSIIDNSTVKSHHQYYITNNTDDFLNLDIKNKNALLNEDCSLSTIYDSLKQTNQIIGSSFFYNVSIYNLKEIKKFNLDFCQYYVDNNMIDIITSNLTSEGYSVNLIHSEIFTEKYISLSFMALPAFLLFISMFFYTISKRKEIMCKKLMGYSNLNIILEDCINNIKNISLITLAIESFNFILIELIYKNSFSSYFNFTYKKLIVILLYTVIILVISNIINLFDKEINYLKGKNKKFDIYIITLVTKIIFCILLIINLTLISSKLISIYSINKINLDISKKTKNYVTLPINTSSTYIGESNQLDYNKRLDEFYNQTVTEFNGVLINTRNYRSLNDRESLSEKFQQNDITINENYLKVNPIHDTSENIINEDLFIKENLNILIPQNINETQIKELYSKRYKINIDDINIIKYLNGEQINSFNPYSGQKNNGLIDDPIILIYNKNFLKNQMLNYVSGQYYFLETSTRTPFNEIKPILVKYGLDGVILESPYISNIFNESISNIKRMLIDDLIKFLIYIIGTFILLIYNSKIYFSIYSKDIAYKRLNGYRFLEIYKIPIVIQGIQIILFLILQIFVNMNIFIILLVAIVEYIIFTIYSKKNQFNNILAVIKGEE